MGAPRGTVAERFWLKVDVAGEDECWLWTGSKTPQGYGKMWFGDGRNEFAHRVSWLLHHGELPAYELDHLCRQPACVNIAHLEDVPHRVNALRGEAPNVILHREGVCRNGHPRSEAYLRRGTNLVVYCRACRREQTKADHA